MILDDRILKKTKIVFFNPLALTKLSFLCKSSDAEIEKLVYDFLVRLCTDVKYGICFVDSTTNAVSKYVNSFPQYMSNIYCSLLRKSLVVRFMGKKLYEELQRLNTWSEENYPNKSLCSASLLVPLKKTSNYNIKQVAGIIDFIRNITWNTSWNRTWVILCATLKFY